MRNIPTAFVALVVAGLALSNLTAPLFAQRAGGEAGIKPITREARTEAIACGKSGTDCAIAPYRLCSPEIGPQYSAWIASPFSRVASSIFEALAKHAKPDPMTPGEANGWGVGIYVSPSEDFGTAAAIERIVIRRAGATIEPITTTIAPVAVTNPQGRKKQLSKGFFAFPMEAFAPTSDITIVLIGSAGEATCSLDRRRLSILR